jgi:hypothetical protein
MSETSQGTGWWMASDHKWYPPEAHPEATPATAHGYILSPGLTTATRILSWITAGAALLYAATLIHEAWRFDQWWNASGFGGTELQDFLDADDLSSGAGGLMFLVSIALFVLMIIWLNKARRTANRFGGTETTWSPGWAIGAWFIPFANFILVKLIFMEVERLSSADADPVPVAGRWKQVRLAADGWWWFFLGLAGVITAIVGNALIEDAEDGLLFFDSGQYISGHIVTAVALGISAAGLIVGAAMLQRLDRQLRRNAGST